jgi:hypothetical protein
MHTERKITMKRLTLILIPALALTGITTNAYGWEQDWELDTQMAVLDQPVRRAIILPYGDGRQRGAPQSPFYKQQSPAAQGDFRELPPANGGGPVGGLPTFAKPGGTSPGTGGGTSPGSGGGTPPPTAPEKPNDPGGGPQQPVGPQIDPPDIGGPDIPLPPIPGFPIPGG